MKQTIELKGFERQKLEEIEEFFNKQFTALVGAQAYEVNYNKKGGMIIKFSLDEGFKETRDVVLNRVVEILLEGFVVKEDLS